MTNDDRTTHGLNWFKELNETRKIKAFELLLDLAIRNESVGVWSPESIKEFIEEAEEEGDNRTVDYNAPYLCQCGNPIA